MTLDPDLPRLWTHEPHVHLQFRAGQKVDDIDTDATPGFRGSKSDAPALQDERNIRFAELQEMLYANSRSGDTRSVLLILQGMDTAGKGGIVKHVVGAGNPQGIRYTSFGKPTEDELAHHYLWRIRNALPPAGHSEAAPIRLLGGRPAQPSTSAPVAPRPESSTKRRVSFMPSCSRASPRRRCGWPPARAGRCHSGRGW